MGVRRILRNNREQPRVASVLLSDYAKPFTHIFNFSDDHFKNLVSGSTGLVNATGGAAYLTLSSGIGPGIVGLSASNEAEGYISVTGNPFATSTCTYLWVESATTLDTNGSCIATSRYSKTSAGEIAALQVRITATDIYVLRAQQAVTLTASSARIAGALNVGAVTVNGNNGRHAAFSGGRLVASATPTTTYTHGTSGIFNTVEADALNFLGPMALFAFAPTALPDDMMIRLTENPYRLFDVRTGRKFFIPSAGGGGATITGDSGSYTLTGTAATLKAGRKLAADSGTYNLTGTAAALKVGRKLTADSGTYTLTGTAVAFKRGYALGAESGTYTVSGTSVNLKAGRKLTADSGSYALTGTDVTLNYSPAGSYNLTAESGTYTLTGTAATLKVSRKLTADSGAYPLTGTDVTLSKGVKLTADSGSYTLSGSNVAFSRTYVLTAESGAYTLTGTSAGLTWSGAPVVEAPTNGGPSIYGKPVFREKQFRKEYEEQVKRIEDEKRLARILREDEEITVIMALMAA